MRAYERFLNYVKIPTTSSYTSGTHPSNKQFFHLANRLVLELRRLGVSDAFVDEHCYVYGSLPATPGYENAPALGFIAHMDTSPDASGENIHPILHENYDGSKVFLPKGGRVLDPDRFPFLTAHMGQTLISTDGSTLLGADDKAGIAEIITAVETLISEGRPHGKICVSFTPDEEIGEGADFFDVPLFGADFAFTMDGEEVDHINYETFNAAHALIDIQGVNIHPGSAKDLMINAANVAIEFHRLLPRQERPECTEGREGFFHLSDMTGTVSEAHLSYLIRDHSREVFEHRKMQMEKAAEALNQKYGDGTVKVSIKDSYYNMADVLRDYPSLIDKAHEAITRVGLTPVDDPVRGGTDGARLTFMGLPCPNLGTGGYNFHGELECIFAEDMDLAVQIILALTDIFKDETK